MKDLKFNIYISDKSVQIVNGSFTWDDTDPSTSLNK